MNVRPLLDKILVKVCENSELSHGGVYTGKATTTFVNGRDKAVQQTVGEVVAIGNGKINKTGERRPPECDIGDIVCFSDSCGIFMDDEHLMIREQDIAFFMDEPTTVELVYN